MANIKTYGVKGLMEWQAIIRTGKARLHINFTGGLPTGYGIKPAEYTTGNEIIQKIIENSQDFRVGKITLLRSIQDKKPVTPRSEKRDCKKVTVACLDDAKEYLCDRFGLEPSKLKSANSIISHAAKNGIEFIGI